MKIMASKRCPEQMEKTRRQEHLNKLYEAKKLILVLDLDQTLIDTTKYFSNNLKDKEKLENTEISTRHLIYRLENSQYWLKLRPGIWNFLHKASKLFELHVNTMAGITYAKEVISILDPTGVLFDGRVTATDWGKWRKFKTLDAMMGVNSTLIVDDTESVWPCNEKNLIHAKGYTYFRSKKCNNGHSSSFEIDPDESVEHGTLAEILALLERVHCEFFAQPSLEKADVRKILEKQQRNVLSWCSIFFSGIIPEREAYPHLHPLWRLAEKFGAVCSNDLYGKVTHVIVKSSDEADKEVIDWALLNGKFVVTVEWLKTSAWLCRWADENKFAVKQAKPDQKSKGNVNAN